MDHRSPSFEATLLCKTAPKLKHTTLIQDVLRTIELSDERVESHEIIEESYALFTCETCFVLVSVDETPLPMEPFLSAERPDLGATDGDRIIEDLTQIGASATVLVMDRDPDDPLLGQAHHDRMRVLCWDVSFSVHNHSGNSLMYWSDLNLLFTAEEFVTCWAAESHLALPANGFSQTVHSDQPVDITPETPPLATSVPVAKPDLPDVGAAAPQAFTTHRFLSMVSMACSSATVCLVGLSNF